MKENTRGNTPVEEMNEQVFGICHNFSLYTSRPLSKNYGDIDPAHHLQNNEKKPLKNSLGDSDKKDIELTKDFKTKDVGLPQVLLPLDVRNEEVVGHVEANLEPKFSTFCNVDDQDNQENTIFSKIFDDEPSDEDLLACWMDRPIEQWSKKDMAQWYLEKACVMGHSFREMASTLVMPGTDLLRLSESDFISHDRYFGKKLFDSLQDLKRLQDSAKASVEVKSSETLSSHNTKEEKAVDWENKTIDEWTKKDMAQWYLEKACVMGHSFCEMASTLVMPGTDLLRLSESDFSSHDRHFGKQLFDSLQGIKRSQDSVRDGTHVDYLRNLLHDQRYCSRWVEWTDLKRKRFRIVNSKKVAKFWGLRRGINDMSWGSFRRGLSNHYRNGILRKVHGKHLHYEFDPNVGGLDSDDPDSAIDNLLEL